MEDMQKESHPAAAATAGGKIVMAKGKRRTTSKLPGTRLDYKAHTKYGHDKVSDNDICHLLTKNFNVKGESEAGANAE